MRISTSSYPNQLLHQLSQLSERHVDLQKQVASGQRLEKASDDPAAAGRVRRMQMEQLDRASDRRNLDRADTYLDFATKSTQALQDLSRMALDTVGLLTGADSQVELDRAASQIDDVLEQALTIVNDEINGTPIYAGDTTDVTPFTTTTDVNGNITAVTYNGGTGEFAFDVGAGVRLSPLPDGQTNTELESWLNGLIAMRDQLHAGDHAAISTQAQALNAQDETILLQIAELGSKAVRLDFVRDTENARFGALEDEISKETDVDLAQAAVRLNTVQTAYQGALKSAERIMGLSLLDYV